jgi:hypothetical protein
LSTAIQDPIEAIRALVARGDYADAAEAIAGLPWPQRDRELANLHFQTFSLRASRQAALRVLDREPDDSEMVRVLADLDFTEGRYADAREGYVKAKSAVAGDPRLSDTDREHAESVLTGREEMLRSAASYRDAAHAAERTALTVASGGAAVLLLAGLVLVLWVRRGVKLAAG